MGLLDYAKYSKDAAVALSRITSTIKGSFDYLEDEDERERLENLADAKQRHQHRQKCQVWDPVAEQWVCRFDCPWELHMDNGLREIQPDVPDDVAEVYRTPALWVLNHVCLVPCME
jgi:hypothetical protein